MRRQRFGPPVRRRWRAKDDMSRNIEGRLRQLEKSQGGEQIRPFTVVKSACWKKLNLETSTCKRTLNRNGVLMQIVDLDGSREGFSNEELYKFIAQFPIERLP